MSGQRTRDVVVIGGGLVGLTTALVLRHHGVDVVLLERHATTSRQPKARRFGFRSMEVFRSLGLAGTVRDAARDLAGHDHFAAGRTLAEAEQLPLWGGAPMVPPPERVGPEMPCLIAQDVLEPVLADAARDAGVDVRFGVAAGGVRRDVDGVTVDPIGRARFVVAADGARSPVRELLGVTRSGRGAVGSPTLSVYFRADLGTLVRGREFNLCHVTHPDATGAIASIDGRHRWVLMTTTPSRDPEALLRTAVGTPMPDLEVLDAQEWRPEMLVADRYRCGPVLLAGDAAHVMPPWAAAGANTGIGDAFNLGWKLTAVLRGEAGDALLDSYDAERRPTGRFVAEQSCLRSSGPGGPPAPDLAHPFVLSAESIGYPAGAFVPGAGADPLAEFAPSGRPGTRVPHRVLDDGRSTLDVAGPGWATLAGVDVLAPGERMLLRPDGIVAWRGSDPNGPDRVRRELLAA